MLWKYIAYIKYYEYKRDTLYETDPFYILSVSFVNQSKALDFGWCVAFNTIWITSWHLYIKSLTKL